MRPHMPAAPHAAPARPGGGLGGHGGGLLLLRHLLGSPGGLLQQLDEGERSSRRGRLSMPYERRSTRAAAGRGGGECPAVCSGARSGFKPLDWQPKLCCRGPRQPPARAPTVKWGLTAARGVLAGAGLSGWYCCGGLCCLQLNGAEGRGQGGPVPACSALLLGRTWLCGALPLDTRCPSAPSWLPRLPRSRTGRWRGAGRPGRRRQAPPGAAPAPGPPAAPAAAAAALLAGAGRLPQLAPQLRLPPLPHPGACCAGGA